MTTKKVVWKSNLTLCVCCGGGGGAMQPRKAYILCKYQISLKHLHMYRYPRAMWCKVYRNLGQVYITYSKRTGGEEKMEEDMGFHVNCGI